jgi:spore coat polysaccharide biosynthesis predicted glycosyltransferase SpsG
MFALSIESSHQRGMGHLYRGLILADALHAKGHSIILLMNDHQASHDIARTRGYEPIAVNYADMQSGWEKSLITQKSIRVWINDRLQTDAAHAQHVKSVGIPLVTFDDLGSGAALADLQIAALNSSGATKTGQQILRGIDYLILSPEIARFRRIRTQIRSIVITLGGSDTYGVTLNIVKQLVALDKPATVIVGPLFEHHEELDAALTPRFILKRGVSSMIAEMARHDLAITGGGITPFEANAAGLPCIIIANETFEIANGQLLEALGGAVFAGCRHSINTDIFGYDLPIESMSRAGIEAVGLAGTVRAVAALEALL